MTDQTAAPQTDASMMTMMEHLRELRSRIVKVAMAVSITSVVAFFFYDQIYDFLTDPYCKAVEGSDQACEFIFLNLTSPFATKLRVSGYAGLLLASPVVFYQLWSFIAPGLYRKEKRYAASFVVGSVVLFLLGAALAFISMPAIFSWLASQAGDAIIQNRVEEYLGLLVIMVMAFGVSFEFPLLLVVLQIFGVLQPSTLAAYRRHAIVGIAAFVATVTPGGDPVSLAVLSIPLVLFYEASIVIGRIIVKRRAEAQPQR